MSEDEKVRKNKKYNQEEVYNILTKEITELEVLPGTALSENSLSDRFGLSRTPIRSVLQRLQGEGFINIIPHKGSIITRIHLNIVNQMIYNRVAVEAMVLSDFITSKQPADVEKIRYTIGLHSEMGKKLLQNAEKGKISTKEVNDLLTLDLKIHENWFTMTGKSYLWTLLKKPHPDYARFIRLDIRNGGNIADTLTEHEQLMGIIDKNDSNAIIPLLKNHLYGGVKRLSADLFSGSLHNFIE